MHVTEEDAALMYARACYAWYGPNATRIVRKRIKELERANDAPGVRIWSRVAEHVSRLYRERAHSSRRKHFFD